MLLFVNRTSEDIIDVFDLDSFKRIGSVSYDNSKHQRPIGPRMGMEFLSYGVVANCFDDTISFIDKGTLKEVKTIEVGRYPIAMASDKTNLYIACGDSSSIWVVDSSLEVAFIESTVDFPFAISCDEYSLCVCGFSQGQIRIYSTHDLKDKAEFFVSGHPMDAVYLDGDPVICCCRENGAYLFWKGNYIPLGERVGKISKWRDKIYVAVNDENILVLDKTLKRVRGFCASEPIDDFEVCDDAIYVSGLLSGNIKKFSQKGELLGCAYTGKGSRGLFISS